jgi:hypothetical protein
MAGIGAEQAPEPAFERGQVLEIGREGWNSVIGAAQSGGRALRPRMQQKLVLGPESSLGTAPARVF